MKHQRFDVAPGHPQAQLKHEIWPFYNGRVIFFKGPPQSIEQAQVSLQHGAGPEQDMLQTEAGAGLKSRICSALGQVLAQIEHALNSRTCSTLGQVLA